MREQRPKTKMDFIQFLITKTKVPNFVATVTYLKFDVSGEINIKERRYGYKMNDSDKDETYVWVCNVDVLSKDNVKVEGSIYEQVMISLDLYGEIDESMMDLMVRKILIEVNNKIVCRRISCVKIM